MWVRKLFCALLALFCLQAVVAQEELTDKYLSIRDKLISLKASSELVTEQLIQVSENLKLSQKEAEEWKQTSTTLSENLMNINEQLNDSYRVIEQEKLKNQKLTKSLWALIIIFLMLVLTVLFILYLELTHKTNFI